MINNKRKMYTSHKKQMMKKAQKLANATCSVIGKSCDKLMIGKTYWKNLALPSVLHGVEAINLTETDVNKLQTIENSVYRKILNAPTYATKCSMRGEIGSSLMMKRIIKGRIMYLKSIEEGKNQLVKRIVELMKEDTRFTWHQTNKKYFEQMKLNYRKISEKNRKQLNDILNDWDTKTWRAELENKSSLRIYRNYKNEIKEESAIYDNTPASTIMYRARANCLQLNDRKRFGNEETNCTLCGQEEENIVHFILTCPELANIRSENYMKEFQQPYIENKDEIIGDLLFKTENMEEKKEVIYKLWITKKKIIENNNRNSQIAHN